MHTVAIIDNSLRNQFHRDRIWFAVIVPACFIAVAVALVVGKWS
jgi:hypothetical protein